jgi:hypothetical protein
LKSSIFFIFLFPTTLAGQSQSFLEGFLFDQESKQPIPFATIKVLHKPFGTFTNDKGKFDVEALPSDTLLITSVGFATKKVVVFSSDTFFLTPIFKELKQVIVSGKHLISTLTLGIEAKTSFQWGPSGFGEEFAQKINLNLNNNEYCKLKKVTLSVKRFSAEELVLLHIYSIDTLTGLPLNELLTKKYFITKDNFRKSKITVDVSLENIYVDESSIFVSFEWLGYGKNNITRPKSSTIINMTNDLNQCFTYSRTLAYSSYDWFLAPKINNKITNTMFQIEIDKLSYIPDRARQTLQQ